MKYLLALVAFTAPLLAAQLIEYDSLPIFVGGGRIVSTNGYCVGASPGLPPSLSACKGVYFDVKSAAERLGYASACNDPGLHLLFSKLYQESGCNPNINAQGLFQIPDCEKEECSYRENVERGLTESIHNCIAVKTALPPRLQKTESIAEATLFAYNRGEGTLARAITLARSGGKDWGQSMVEACQTEYDRGSYKGCSGFDRNACCGLPGTYKGKYHDGNGLGARYPEKILGIYRRACREQGGRPA